MCKQSKPGDWLVVLGDLNVQLPGNLEETTGEVRYTRLSRALDECLTHLRDRVGVPRDMSHAAARELRAHLNWALDIVLAPAPSVETEYSTQMRTTDSH